MSVRARIDIDATFHDATATTLTVGNLAEHIAPSITTAQAITGTVGTSAVQIAGTPPLLSLVLKNTGSGVLRLAGAIDVQAGRVSCLPVTATITVSAPGGSGSYSALWVG